jgi:glucose/mannose-6-phosphate isomerase
VSLLDDAAALAAADPGRMLDAVEAAPALWAAGVRAARAVDLGRPPTARAVVVAGMGGSGVAGDVAAAAAAERGRVPVTAVKGYRLPAWAGPGTPVVCCSYSGDTEEALACFEEACRRGAPVVAVATGGRLGALADERGVPRVAPPPGLAPRAAFPFLAATVLVVLERLGALPDLVDELAAAEEALARQAGAAGRAVPAARNPAKRLAADLAGCLPVVWGQEGPLAVAAARWKAQLNENAKVPAAWGVLPELDHNEVVGLEAGRDLLERLAVVVLRAREEDPRLARRVEATVRLAAGRVGRVLEAWAEGRTPLARLCAAVLLGDLVSVYLAVLRGVDPTPVRAIERLKAELA